MLADQVDQDKIVVPPYIASNSVGFHKEYPKQLYKQVIEPELTMKPNYKAIKLFDPQELVKHLQKHFPLVRKNVQQFDDQMKKLSLTFGNLILNGFHIDDFLKKFFLVVDKRLHKFFDHLDHKVLKQDGNQIQEQIPGDYRFGDIRQQIRQKLIDMSQELYEKFGVKRTPPEFDREIIKKIDQILRVYEQLKYDQGWNFVISITKFNLEDLLERVCNNELTQFSRLDDLIENMFLISMKPIKDATIREPSFANKDITLAKFHSIINDRADPQMSTDDLFYISKTVCMRDRRIIYNEFYNQINQQLKEIAPEYFQFSTTGKSDYQKEREELHKNLLKIQKEWEALKMDENYYLVLEDRINEEDLRTVPLTSEQQLHQLQRLNTFANKASNLQYDAVDLLKKILDHKDKSKEQVESKLQEALDKAKQHYANMVPGRKPQANQIKQHVDALYNELQLLLHSDPTKYQTQGTQLEKQIESSLQKNKQNPYLQHVAKEIQREKQAKEQAAKRQENEARQRAEQLNAQVDLMIQQKNTRDLQSESVTTRPYSNVTYAGKILEGSSVVNEAHYERNYDDYKRPSTEDGRGKYESEIIKQKDHKTPSLNRDVYMPSNKGYYVDDIIGVPKNPEDYRKEIVRQQADRKSNEPKQQTKKPEAPKEQPRKPEPPKEQPKKPEPSKEQPKKPEPPKEQPKKPEPPKEQPKKPEPPKEQPKKPEPPKEQPKKPEPPKEQPKKPEPPKEQPKQPEPPKKPEPPKEQPKQPEPPKKPEPPKEQPKQPEPPKKPEPPKEQPKQPEPPKKPEPPKEPPKQPEPPKKPEPPKEPPKQPEPPKKPEPPKEPPKQPEPPKKPEPPKEPPKQPEPPKKPEPPKEPPKQPEPPKKPEPPKEPPKQPEPPKKPEPPKEPPKQPEPPKKPEPPKEPQKQPEPPKKPEPPKEPPHQPEPPKKPEPPKEQPKQPEPPKKPEPPKEQPKQPEPPKKPEPPKEQPKQPEPPKKPEPPKEQPKQPAPNYRDPYAIDLDDDDQFGEEDDDDFTSAYIPNKVQPPQQPQKQNQPQVPVQKPPGPGDFGFSDDDKEIDKIGGEEGDEPFEQLPLITKETLALVSKYIKGTKYGKNTPIVTDELAGHEVIIQMFEEFILQDEAYFLDFDETQLLYAIYEKAAADEDCNPEIEECMKSIDMKYMERTQKQGFGEAMKIYYPFEDNPFEFYLLEKDPIQKILVLYYDAQPSEAASGEELETFLQIFQQLFQCEDFEISQVVLTPATQRKMASLKGDAKYLKYLFTLFTILYEQQSQIPDIEVTDDTVGRAYWALSSCTEIYGVLQENDEELRAYFMDILQKAQDTDKVNLVTQIEDYFSQEGIANIQDQIQMVYEDFLKNKQTKQYFFSVDIVVPQQQTKYTYYVHLSRVAQLSFLKVFMMQHYAEMNEQVLPLFLTGDGLFTQKVYIDYARHNFLYEYGDASLGAWYHLVVKKNYKPEEAMGMMAFSLAPYNIILSKQE